MHWWNHELPKRNEIRWSGKGEHFLPTYGTRHNSLSKQLETSRVSHSMNKPFQHIVTQGCKICEQGLYQCMTTIEFYKSSLKFLWRMFNNLEPLNKKSSHFEQTRSYRTNCERKNIPYAGDSGILLFKLWDMLFIQNSTRVRGVLYDLPTGPVVAYTNFLYIIGPFTWHKACLACVMAPHSTTLTKPVILTLHKPHQHSDGNTLHIHMWAS